MHIHINPAWNWYCGSAGTTTTNEKQVTCPECLALLEIHNGSNIMTHPLFNFFVEVIKEYNKGRLKYGDWSGHGPLWQKAAVKSECLEWEATSLKTVGGEQRELQELTHLANVAGKRWNELKGKK